MKIRALCGITAPNAKGQSITFKPDDIGDVEDETARKLIREGFAERAGKNEEATARETKTIAKLPKPGTPKTALKPGKATAIKPKKGETEGAKKTRKRKKDLLGDEGGDPDRGVGENGKKFEDD